MNDMKGFFNNPTTTGKMIKAFRVNFKVTQKEMSEVIDVSETNLSAIENDRREIGVDIALRIGAFLGLHPSILLFPNGEEVALEKHKNIIKKAKKLIRKKRKDG